VTRPELIIELDDDGFVVISPSIEVSQIQWYKTVHYWASRNNFDQNGRSITVPIEIFVEKASWLRDVWKAQEGLLTLSPAVVSASKNIADGVTSFKKLRTLADSRHFGETIEVPGLLQTRKLTQEQYENILCLLDMDNGANFSVPGSGKTLTALSVWKILKSHGKVQKALVICPRSAFESWRTELIDSFGESLNFEVYDSEIIATSTDLCVVNYEQLENSRKLSYLKSWTKAHKCLVIIDEAHRIKGGRVSVRWNAVKSLSVSASRTDVLTGTPMPQGPKDLTSIYSVAWPHLTKYELSERILTQLKRKTAFVRTTKDELGLPDPTIRLVTEAAGPLQAQILSALQDRYVGSFQLSIADQKNLARRGKAVMTMLAAATNPGLLVSRQFSEFEMGFSWPPRAVLDDRPLSEMVENYLHHEIPWKFKYVALRTQELANQNQKVLVWSSFIGNLASLKAVLAKFNPAVVYGNTPASERESEISRFRNDPNCNVLLSNPQTLGEGISLHKHCHAEIFVDRTYNAGLYLQAVDRIHRLGLDSDQETQIEILQTSGSIDERVGSRLAIKIAALANFLQDKKLTQTALPQDDAFAPIDILGLSEEDFKDIAAYWGRGN
jgi:SNF2 family DNA or RNA helicase